ncbi:hypothetical protein Leryth_009814 [Lithospermum erythrorhizon]|nr:hypothetical protein Leryth_009814 [Lithospermum erythrorhizon]
MLLSHYYVEKNDNLELEARPPVPFITLPHSTLTSYTSPPPTSSLGVTFHANSILTSFRKWYFDRDESAPQSLDLFLTVDCFFCFQPNQKKTLGWTAICSILTVDCSIVTVDCGEFLSIYTLFGYQLSPHSRSESRAGKARNTLERTLNTNTHVDDAANPPLILHFLAPLPQAQISREVGNFSHTLWANMVSQLGEALQQGLFVSLCGELSCTQQKFWSSADYNTFKQDLTLKKQGARKSLALQQIIATQECSGLSDTPMQISLDDRLFYIVVAIVSQERSISLEGVDYTCLLYQWMFLIALGIRYDLNTIRAELENKEFLILLWRTYSWGTSRISRLLLVAFFDETVDGRANVANLSQTAPGNVSSPLGSSECLASTPMSSPFSQNKSPNKSFPISPLKRQMDGTMIGTGADGSPAKKQLTFGANATR